MIDRLTGKLIAKSPTSAVIDCGGVGFAVMIPVSCSEKLPAPGAVVTLMTYLHVREAILELYGFLNEEDRELFITLLSVKDIGPKKALAILSRFSPLQLAEVVANNDTRRLSTVPGIGKGKSEKIILELRGKLKIRSDSPLSAGGIPSTLVEAIRALEILGVPTGQAENAVRTAQKQLGEDSGVEELIKQALRSK